MRPQLSYEGKIIAIVWVILILLAMLALLIYMRTIRISSQICDLGNNINCDYAVSFRGTALVNINNTQGVALENATLRIEEPCIPFEARIENQSEQMFECPVKKGIRGASYKNSMTFSYFARDIKYEKTITINSFYD